MSEHADRPTQTPQRGASANPTLSGPTPPAPVNAYLRNRVMSATPEELRLMLLDGAIKFANQGRDGMVARNYEQMYLGVSQCRNIVFELLTTIREDANPAVCKQMKALYTFMYTHLLESSHEKDPEKLGRVIELLEYDRETWVLLMRKVAGEKQAAPAGGPGDGRPGSPAAAARAPLSVSA